MTMPRFRPAEEVLRYRWIYLGLLIAFAIWGWLDVVPRGMVNHQRINEHRTDFTVYTEAGAAFFDGRDPYQVSNPRGWRYLYPPMFAILVAPLHVLPPMGQVGVWYVLSVGMVFGCYFELRRILALCADSHGPRGEESRPAQHVPVRGRHRCRDVARLQLPAGAGRWRFLNSTC